MDLTLSPSEEGFRDEVATWLRANNPGPEPEGSLDEVMAFRGDWQRKLHAAGWAGISWPKEYGGRGATMIEAKAKYRPSLYDDERHRARTMPMHGRPVTVQLGATPLRRDSRDGSGG